MLIILQDLMHRAFVETEGRAPKRHEIPKPADYFDLIAGTGTGGLIAIMLGRLRLDVETCMETYVRMTKRVFETDKTIAGIPYRSTLFKASKLEEAIRECVREHTIFEDEGNDGTATGGREFPISPISPRGSSGRPERAASVRSTTSLGVTSASTRNSTVGYQGVRWGNPNASLYDDRDTRTKTAVTAVFKGTPKNGLPLLLRSYDSRKEPPPEFNCSIWQAGRATCAISLAFKPIQIGQSVFLDEGAGKYNPAPQILEEAAVNEWPGREIGIFVSIGTGKRPGGTGHQQVEWWEGFVGGGMGEFAEARRRLISKIEACEDTHQQMLKEYIPKYNIPRENYCRLNVEVGVGEFGMNEWSRVRDISTNTRNYLVRPEVQKMVDVSAVKIAKIERSKRRIANRIPDRTSFVEERLDLPQPSHPMVAELPADEAPIRSPQSPRYTPTSHPVSDQEKYILLTSEQQYPAGQGSPPRLSAELAYTPASQHSPSSQSPHNSPLHRPVSSSEAPPLPPKTPIAYNDPSEVGRLQPYSRPQGNVRPPYPDVDGPPPVNKLRKPEYTSR